MDAPGYVVWTGTQYIDRSIDGTANEIVITNAPATGANTIIGIADNPTIPGIEAMTIPRGFVGDRPSVPTNGMIRYFRDTVEFFEGYVDGVWEPFLMGSTSGFLPLAGGTMTGDIDMAGTSLLNVNLVDGRNLDNDGAVIDSLDTGTGIKVQTAASTFVNRQIAVSIPLTITNADGVAGNPAVTLDFTTVTDLEVGQVVDENVDEVLIYDDSQTALRTITPYRLNYHPAQRYFMGQF